MQFFAPLTIMPKARAFRLVGLVLPVVCLLVLLALPAFAQNTYVITDGDQVTVYTGFASDPEQVLGEVGVELTGNDFYTTAAADGVSEITVQREQTVTVDYCGQVLTATSYGETLKELLDRMGLQTYGAYTISEDMSAQVYDGMEVHIDNVVKVQEQYTVEAAFQTVYCSDPNMAKGQERIVVEGQNGQLLQSAEVVYKNAQEQSRIVLEETVLEQPVDQIVAVGTGARVGEDPDAPLIGDGFIVLPTGEVLTYTHTGLFKATAYTHTDEGCDTVTSTGTTVRRGTVAVDPDVIPYGTRMFIVTTDGSYIYGVSTAEDCGGAIQENRLDLYFETTAQCFQFGRRDCIVYFLGDAQGIFW